MLKTKNTIISLFFVFSAAIILVIPSTSTGADPASSEFILDLQTQFIEGNVKRFNAQDQTILLQLKNGVKVTISLDWNTTLIGYDSPKEIERGNKVKIWHSTVNGTDTAIKIVKKLVVGC